MKNIAKFLTVGAAALLTTTVAQAAPGDVIVNFDGSTEGLAFQGPAQTPLGAGVIEIGWVNPGTTEATIDGLFSVGNLAGIDALFNTVATLTFSPGSLNSFGDGLVFEGFTLATFGSGTYAADLAAYKNATTGAAGELLYAWIRDSASLGSTTQMAFVNTTTVFGLANDTIAFLDYETNAALDSTVVGTTTNIWVGAINPVTLGSGADLNGGSAADSTGLNGGANVLQLAAVVPEPSTAVLTLVGLAGIALRRRRA